MLSSSLPPSLLSSRNKIKKQEKKEGEREGRKEGRHQTWPENKEVRDKPAVNITRDAENDGRGLAHRARWAIPAWPLHDRDGTGDPCLL